MAQSALIAFSVCAVFMCGIIVGVMFGERNPPNEPKPTNWNAMLTDEWCKGYHAGRKAAKKDISNQLSNEIRVDQLMEEYRKNHQEKK